MLDYAVISEIGNRNANEDCVGVIEKNGNYCFVVCDGLGGHGMGDIASRFVTDIFLDRFHAGSSCEDFLPSTFSFAQEQLIHHQQENNACNKMRTTVAAVFINGEAVSIGHVGDSRAYVFDSNGIKARTIDHSVPQMLALAGEITDQDIRKHPDRNRLLRAMGSEWIKPMYDICPALDLAQCYAFLLCSDGFWEYITEDQMVDLLKESASAKQWLSAMTAVVKQRGSAERMDNYSAIAVINPDYKHPNEDWVLNQQGITM